MPDRVTYTWDEGPRMYRDGFGRFVPRTRVRDALDHYLDTVEAEVERYTQSLVDGEIGIGEWQGLMEASIKKSHVAATMVARGGHSQVRPADWGLAGQEIRFQYDRLARFARQLEDGLPLDGRVISRAKMYAIAPTKTYEAILRKGDLNAYFDRERRVLHSLESCRECIEYAYRGWQPAGRLPGIGQQSSCLSRCRCTFERVRSAEARKKWRESRMSVSTHSEDRCKRRNRVAAIRDGVDATPLRFLEESEAPTPIDHAVVSINSKRLSSGMTQLGQEDVYIHYLEAANTNFISDRFMFLDKTTLRNVALAGKQGIAFLNSHRTGGLSAPAELPYGRSFDGRYEEDGDGARAYLGVYMVRGHNPNGALSPSTDDLHLGIESGTITDVSMGLAGGDQICDICTRDLSDEDCPHVPGTRMGLTPEQIEAQEARGISGGYASYTLVNSRPNEVSAVYKGAVPGAGFRKAVSLIRGGKADRTVKLQAARSYRGLWSPSELMKLGVQEKGPKPMDLSRLFKFWKAAGEPDLLEIDPNDLGGLMLASEVKAPAVPEVESKAAAELAEREKRFAEQVAQMNIRERAIRKQELTTEAKAFTLPSIKDGRITPAEALAYETLYVQLGHDDAANPLTGPDGKPLLRTELFKTSHSQRVKSGLNVAEVGETPADGKAAFTLPGGDSGPGDGKTTTDRLMQLLSLSPLGSDVLRMANEKK